MKVPITQTEQYTPHAQNNCTILKLTPSIQPFYWAIYTKNSIFTASHTVTFNVKQNINTPNHIMCTIILIQFRSWKTEI